MGEAEAYCEAIVRQKRCSAHIGILFHTKLLTFGADWRILQEMKVASCIFGKLLSTIVVLLLLLGAVPTYSTELLLNPSFSEGSFSFWGGNLANYWSACYSNGAQGATWALMLHGQPHGYTQGVTITNSNTNAGIYQRVTGLPPGANYKFRAFSYQIQPGYLTYIHVDPNSSLPAGALPATGTVLPSEVNNWNYREIVGTVGPGGSVTVYAWADYVSGSTGPVFFDDLSLTITSDPVPPNAIDDLAVSYTLSDSVELTWTAPMGAKLYDVRYSTQPITNANWSSAIPVNVQVPPVPGAHMSIEKMWVRNLAPATTYYFAVRFKDFYDVWSDVSNCATGTTAPAGSAPYWAWHLKEKLYGWYTRTMSDCLAADENTGSPDYFSWYFGGWDPDCERQPGIAALLQIVRDPWLLGFAGRLSDHVWEISYANTCIDKNIYNSTNPHQKVPVWNESHHGGEMSWNGVGITAVDYDNPKWLSRLIEYARHVHHWTGYTGNPPHLHFKTFWVKGDEWDHSAERGVYSLVDNPEDRRFTRALEYASWRDPNSRMPDGKPIKDFLYELDAASAEDAMTTVWGKPVGVLPAEITWNGHQICGYSRTWWRMAGSMGGTVGTSGEWWWDWRVGWTPQRDAYYELIDRYLLTGEERFIIPVRESIRYFVVQQSINDIPPGEMFSELYPWPDNNVPYGTFQIIVYLLYRQATGDTQFDNYFKRYADRLWQVLPPPRAPRYTKIRRSTLQWDTSSGNYSFKAPLPFFLGWKATGDKEYLCKALDETDPNDMWIGVVTEYAYTGTTGAGCLRLPDQPITWNNTAGFTNFAALVTDWSYTHIRWLTYNFDASDKIMPIWIWSLKPGNYVLRHGPDVNGDDRMDYVVETVPFTYSTRRTPLNIVLPTGRLEAWEIMPMERTFSEAKFLADESPVYLASATVTAVFDGFFYVQNDDRTCGIRVDSRVPVSEGSKVDVAGYLQTVSGERRLKCFDVRIRM